MAFLFNRSQNNANFTNLSVADYHTRFHDGEDHILVDVRTPGEFAEGHLPGAINIELSRLPGRLGELGPKKPVVVVCATGNRSRTGAQLIARGGYDEVYNLQGGTMKWQMNRLPLEN